MASYLQDLFDYNNWANQGLLEFVGRLPPETLDMTVPGVYGTVRQTLFHLFTGELFFDSHFVNDPVLERDRPGHPDLAQLQQLARDSAMLTARIATALPDPESKIPDGDGFRRAKTVLTQLVTHGAEHRTHVGTILGAHGIPLPELDSWAYGIFAGYNSWPEDMWGPEPPDRQSARFTIR